MFTAVGPSGERSIPADQFFVGSFCTALGPAEILTGIEMSGLGDGGGAYMKLHRKIGDFATVGVGVQLTMDADGKVSECGIGMTGVALSYVRASKAEEYRPGLRTRVEPFRRVWSISHNTFRVRKVPKWWGASRSRTAGIRQVQPGIPY